MFEADWGNNTALLWQDFMAWKRDTERSPMTLFIEASFCPCFCNFSLFFLKIFQILKSCTESIMKHSCCYETKCGNNNIKCKKVVLNLWDWSSPRWGIPLRPEKSHEHLVLCWAKCASELSPQLHEIILTLDSLQWQRAFWMWCPISQLFNVNYQPTTCQTLTIKMSATKISPLQKKRWNLLSEGMKLAKLIRCYYGRFHALRPYCRGSAGNCFP